MKNFSFFSGLVLLKLIVIQHLAVFNFKRTNNKLFKRTDLYIHTTIKNLLKTATKRGLAITQNSNHN